MDTFDGFKGRAHDNCIQMCIKLATLLSGGDINIKIVFAGSVVGHNGMNVLMSFRASYLRVTRNEVERQ